MAKVIERLRRWLGLSVEDRVTQTPDDDEARRRANDEWDRLAGPAPEDLLPGSKRAQRFRRRRR